MPIEFRCGQCRQHLRVPDTSSGNNARCPQCQALTQIPLQTMPGRIGLPWERKGSSAFLAFFQTAGLVAFRPQRAFDMMRQRGSYRVPMLYSALGLYLGLAGVACVEGLLAAYSFDKLPFEPEVIEVLKQALLIALVAMAVIGIPLTATLGSLISGGLMHVALLIAGGSKQSFATSVRIACYVQPSLTWLLFIPLVGSSLLGIWSLIVSIIAVKHAHEVSVGKAVIAVLVPLVVTSLTLGLILVVFVVSLAAMFSLQTLPG
jgi:hypothetical protein